MLWYAKPMASILPVLSCLILAVTLSDRWCYPHVTSEETEAQSYIVGKGQK